MAKISIASVDGAATVEQAPDFSGNGQARALFNRPVDPIHVYVHLLPPGGRLDFEPHGVDRAAFVWRGNVTARGEPLESGSSLIAERGASLGVLAGDQGATILAFGSAQPVPEARDGGHVHLLPVRDVPRYHGENGLRGGLHADASCPTCAVWLHENHLPGASEPSAVLAEAGIHSHSENEVIFVTAGQIRLTSRLYGPGTAIAIAAGTMYSFTSGPEGLSFLNFRAGLPTEIKFKSGQVMDEVAYWRERVSALTYS